MTFVTYMYIYFQTNGFTRSQTEATVQNVNVALTRTLNKLRQEPLNTNTRSTPMYAGTTPSRPMTARMTTHQNTGTTTTSSSNYYYQLSNNTKGPLPAELITRRPTSSYPTNSTSHNRVSTGSGPLIVQQQTARTDTKTNENTNVRISTPLRVPTKNLETGLHQIDGFNFDNVTLDEHPGRARVRNSISYLLSIFYFFRQQKMTSINKHYQKQYLVNNHQLHVHQVLIINIVHYLKSVSIHKFKVLYNKILINYHIYMNQFQMVNLNLNKSFSFPL
jgi:hypothetical protein